MNPSADIPTTNSNGLEDGSSRKMGSSPTPPPPSNRPKTRLKRGCFGLFLLLYLVILVLANPKAAGETLATGLPAAASAWALLSVISPRGKPQSPLAVGQKAFAIVFAVTTLVCLNDTFRMLLLQKPRLGPHSRITTIPDSILFWLVCGAIFGGAAFIFGWAISALFDTFPRKADAASDSLIYVYSHESPPLSRVSFNSKDGKATLSRRRSVTKPWESIAERTWPDDIMLHEIQKAAEAWMSEK